MNAENVKSQMRKGTLEYCILLLLKKEPAYTSDVIAVKDTIPLKWSRLEWEKAAEIANAVDGIEYAVMQYMDVRNPYEMTKTEVYVGDRKAEFVEADTDGKVYWSLEFSRIEV